MTAIVEARNLRKSYGNHKAVEDVSFSIWEGEIFGLLLLFFWIVAAFRKSLREQY